MRRIEGGSRIEVEREGGVLRLWLDRPAQANALSGDMVSDLVGQLHGLAEDPEVRAVQLGGRGGAFCAGADLGGPDPHQHYDGGSVEAANTLVRAITTLDRPVVCALDGVAAGVGLSLALACDLVVASPRARLTVAFTRIGLMTDGGASALLVAAVGRQRAMRLALTSEVLGAQDAHEWGLVSHLLPAETYEDGLADILHGLATGAPLGLAATKKAVNAVALDGLEGAFAREQAGQAALLRTRDAAEGMAAFGERRRPRFVGE